MSSAQDEISFRFLLGSFGLTAIVAFVLGALLAIWIYTNSCAIAPRLSADGFYRGPEFHCPVPPWYRVGGVTVDVR